MPPVSALARDTSAPRPVAMHRLLDRLLQQRKCFTPASPHVIQISRSASRLTSRVIRFLDARDVLSMGDAAQHLALASHRPSIKANRMQFAQLPTKLCCSKDAKKILGIFLSTRRQKRKRRSIERRSYPLNEKLHQAIALMRALRRDTRRAAAFLAITWLAAPRWISGCAARQAASAAFLSPAAIASSTFLIEPRTRLRRALFATVRRTV